MLRIYPVSIEVTRQVAPLAERVARFDSDHARQLRRSVKGVVFNLAEGAGSRAGRRRNAYDIALGEARETLANLQVAEALRYVPKLDPRLVAQLNQIIGTLVRLLH
jgi:four helix bundle protein